jgi:hypothetical protein
MPIRSKRIIRCYGSASFYVAPAQVGLKRKFSFSYFRKNFFCFLRKKLAKSCEHFRKSFRENLERGSGSRSHLNVYPDPNTGGCYLIFSRKPSWEQKFFTKTVAKTKMFAKTFAKTKIFVKSFAKTKIRTKFRENGASFRLFSLFAKMKKGVFVSTLGTG